MIARGRSWVIVVFLLLEMVCPLHPRLSCEIRRVVTSGCFEVFLEQTLGEGLEGFAGFGEGEGFGFWSDQSSLKLVVRAEIQIWRTGVCGVKTNLVPPSSKRTLRTPFFSSASKPNSSSAAMRDCLRDSRAWSERRRKVGSSSMV